MNLSKAPHESLRYNEVVNWLMENGFTDNAVRDLVKLGVIEPWALKPGGRVWYSASQITRALGEQKVESRK